MSTFQERLDNAAGSTTCQILSAGGSALVGAGAWNLATGVPGVAALTVGSVALLASNYACDWDPQGESTLPSAEGIASGQCMETEGCDLVLVRPDPFGNYTGPVRKLISSVASGTYPNGTPRCTTTWINCDGDTVSDDEAISQTWPITTYVRDGGTCVGDPSPPNPPAYPDYEYEEPAGPDGEPGCSLTVNVLGWGANADGTVAPIYKISPKTELRADGGVIGGCNFEPVVYYQPKPPGGGPGGGGGDGDPPYTIPFVPGGDGDDPEWLRLLKNALAGAAGNLLASAIKELLEQPVEGVKYEMLAPCDFDAEGNQLLWEGEIPEQKADLAILDRLDAISNQLTQHLQWKTPICKPEKPELRGSWVTTRWISDEKMDHSGKRLRKLLRYRSESSRDLGQLSAYWQDFTWNAGDIIVFHKGAWWGTPKVWAETQEEGQRVLRFAAAEAGIDPDQAGEWGVSGSSSSRYGMSGTMRIQRYEGFPWVAKRSSPEWPNQLALQSDS